MNQNSEMCGSSLTRDTSYMATGGWVGKAGGTGMRGHDDVSVAAGH